MLKNRIFLSILAAGALAACGDDEVTPEGTDAGGVDTGIETDGSTVVPDAGDVTETPDGDTSVTPDTDTTVVPDVPVVPATETVCGDEVDNDEDGDTDCDDSDCADNIVCQEDPGCGECPTGTVCVDDTICLYPDIQTPETYVPSEVWSILTALRIADVIPAGESYTEAQVSGGEAGAICCFDIDGDETVDNGLAGLAETLGAIAGDVNELLAEQLEGGSFTLLAEYKSGFYGTNPSQLHFFIGTNDVDGDGEPDQTYDVIQDGDGVFLITEAAFGPRGSLIQFNRGQYDTASGEFVSPAEEFFLTLPLGGLIDGLGDVSLTINDARLEADLDPAEPTTSVNFEEDGQEYGGARLGGFISLDELFGVLDDIVQDSCGCAVGNSSGEPPVIVYGEGAGTRADRYGIACNDNSFDISACEAGNVICDNLSLVCGTGASLISSLQIADIDTNGNGIDDSLSVGIFVTMANATIDEAVFEGEGSGSEGSGEGSGTP
jgi:hypothetical protein